jgi:hypothetical protein
MSSSPFELFRRNLKPLMVLLTLLALFSFVVLPSVAMYQQRAASMGGSDTRLASFDGGEYDLNKVTYFTRTHFATVQFLRQLAETTIARGGTPRVSGFRFDTQQNAIQSLGINSNPSDQASVRTMMFAGEAKKVGLELDDTAVRNWLTSFTDGRLTDAEINGVLQAATRNQLGQFHLYEQLRTQLLSEAYQRRAMAGLAVEGRPIVPPAQQWDLFLRLNRNAVADAFAVNVADFLDKTSDKPSPKEIERVYEEGKTRFPDDESPLPAFRRPYLANIEYVSGSLDDFIAREIESLTEDQLRAEYQRRLEGGDFKMPEESPQDGQPAAEVVPAEDAAAEDAEMPAEEGDGEPQVEATQAESTEPAVEDSSTETPATEAPATETPATEAPATEAPATEAPATEAPATEAPATETPAAETQSRVVPQDRAVMLVAARAQEDVAEAATETPAADDAPAADAPAAAVETPATEAPAEAKTQSFEDVRDEIARSMATQPALAKLDAAVTEVDKAMRTYFNERAIAGPNAEKIPERPNLKALAEKLGMRHGETGLIDARQLQDQPIVRSFGVGVGMQRGNSFLQTMFIDRPTMFAPVRTVDDQAALSFVSWKTEDRESSIPTLDEARDEVVLAIRMTEARKLARAQAEKWSTEFNQSDKPIRELVPSEQSSLVFESLGPFSWMSSFGFGMQAFMGNVPELDRVGEAFMRQVFTSEREEWGVAPNSPETVFYVVRPTEFSPSTDELHQRFSQMIQRFQASTLAVEEVVQVRDGFYEALDKQTGFKWNEEALP